MTQKKTYSRNATSREKDRLYHLQPSRKEAQRANLKSYRSTLNGARVTKEQHHGPVRRNRELVNEFKKRVPCAECQRNFPSCAMDFDHIDGVKTYNIGYLVSAGASLPILLAEIAKCELVCACCHRVRTQNRKEQMSFSVKGE